jgi:formylglycine-generating enzyme required for sulfatase activity
MFLARETSILALIIGIALVSAFSGCRNPIMVKLLEPLAPKTVSYHINGGTGQTPAAQKVKAGESVTLPGGDGLAKIGCAFGGWNTNASGTGTNYTASSSYTPQKTVTLYARWDTAAHIHEWGEWAVTRAPTETEDGEETRTCALDAAHTETRYIAALNHTHEWSEWAVTTPATCTTAGEETRICTHNATHKEMRPIAIDPNAHDWGAWTVTTPPTETVDGEETRTCAHDTAHKETRPIYSKMVWVPGGSFEMGKELGTAGSGDTTPVHTVTLSGFYMGRYQVTQAQYQAVMGSNPSYFDSSPASGEVQGNRPVESVSWYDAIVFCNKLSMAEGLTPAYSISNSTNPSDWGAVPTSSNSTWDAAVIVSGSAGYRLPTEAQWEYAAKGGNGTPGNYIYSGSNTVGDVAWYDGNSNSMTHEVGKKTANGLGIYDISGNVWEWCWDWYDSYSSSAQNNPAGPASGSARVIRGGSWSYDASYARSVYRDLNISYFRYYYIGFRLVRP